MLDQGFLYRLCLPGETPEVAAERVKSAERAEPRFHLLPEYLSIGVWERGPVLVGEHEACVAIRTKLVAELRRMGWWVGRDRNSVVGRNPNRFRSLEVPLIAARGRMRAEIELRGRCLDIKMWPDHNSEHCNGPRYSHLRWKIMGPRDRRIAIHALSRLHAILAAMGLPDSTRPVFDDPLQRLEYEYRTDWHKTWSGSLFDRYRVGDSRNDIDGDRGRMVNGDVRYMYDDWLGETGRLVRGVVFHHINNMWWVVAGGKLRNVGAHSLFRSPAGRPRRFTGTSRLRRLLDSAVKREDFETAIHLRDQLRAREGSARRAA